MLVNNEEKCYNSSESNEHEDSNCSEGILYSPIEFPTKNDFQNSNDFTNNRVMKLSPNRLIEEEKKESGEKIDTAKDFGSVKSNLAVDRLLYQSSIGQ